MIRKNIGSVFDRNNRNAMNDNFEYLFEGSRKINELNYRADIILNEAKQTNDMNKDVQKQLDELILHAGESDAEVIQARGEHTLLSERLNSVDEKIKQNSDEYNKVKPYFKTPVESTKKAYMTILDDDAREEVWTKLKPIAEEKGVPITLAVPVNFPGNRKALSRERLLYLQDELNWEMASHSYTHPNMRVMNEEELKIELIDSKRELESWGLEINHFVFPYGSGTGSDNSNFTRELTSRYYESASAVGGGVNKKPIKNYSISRVAFGSYTNGNNTLEYYKGRVDSAIKDNGWIVFMTHCHEEDHDETQQQYLREVIDYAKLKGVEIVNVSDGFKAMGNAIEIESKFSVTNDGKILGENAPATRIMANNAVDGSEPPSHFERNIISNIAISSWNAGNFPEGKPGTYTVEAINETGYYKAYYKIYNSPKIYQRYQKFPSGEWSNWELITQEKHRQLTKIDMGTITKTAVFFIDIQNSIINLGEGAVTLVVHPYRNSQLPQEILYNASLSNNRVRITVYNTHTSPMNVGEKEFVVTLIR